MRIPLCITAGTLALACALTGCSKASTHASQLDASKEREFTLGLAQKEIRQGMSQAEVASTLGSPNIVTKDATGIESWIYDKIATEASDSQDHGGIWLILGGYGKEAGARSSTQKTLTIVIKFDAEQRVGSVSYNSSTF
jgi:outer membrane protein assembly factor BamE (lipoprotein component of BamABCDE complex)